MEEGKKQQLFWRLRIGSSHLIRISQAKSSHERSFSLPWQLPNYFTVPFNRSITSSHKQKICSWERNCTNSVVYKKNVGSVVGDTRTHQSGIRMRRFLSAEQAQGICGSRAWRNSMRKLMDQVSDRKAWESLPLWESVILNYDSHQFIEQKLKGSSLTSQRDYWSVGSGFSHSG